MWRYGINIYVLPIGRWACGFQDLIEMDLNLVWSMYLSKRRIPVSSSLEKTQ